MQCTLRSSKPSFSYKEQCLFCECTDIRGGRDDKWKLIPVRTADFQSHILRACEKFKGDWVDSVKARVSFAQDLHAADAVYHKLCSSNFRNGLHIPQIFQTHDGGSFKKSKTSGRPKDTITHDAFLKVTEYLEATDDEQTTVNDLIQKMKEYEECEPYSFTHMKTQLKKHFGDQIVITEISGKSNVVTLQRTAARILHDFHHESKQNMCDGKMHIIETAAKLIRNDIRNIKQPRDAYPSPNDMSSIEENVNFLPESLQSFLKLLFVGNAAETKIASVGQVIVQATRPRVIIAPLQIGLGVQLHSHFHSKFLIDFLHACGFCSSYSEVVKYEKCSAVMQGTDIPNYVPGCFHQYVGDNADHDSITIDGKNTFHGMGIIAAVTPGTKCTEKVPRKDVTSADIAAVAKISIYNYVSETDSQLHMCYGTLDKLHVKEPFCKYRFAVETFTGRKISKTNVEWIHAACA